MRRRNRWDMTKSGLRSWSHSKKHKETYSPIDFSLLVVPVGHLRGLGRFFLRHGLVTSTPHRGLGLGAGGFITCDGLCKYTTAWNLRELEKSWSRTGQGRKIKVWRGWAGVGIFWFERSLHWEKHWWLQIQDLWLGTARSETCVVLCPCSLQPKPIFHVGLLYVAVDRVDRMIFGTWLDRGWCLVCARENQLVYTRYSLDSYTWSLVSACVEERTWTLLAPHPTPTPTPHDHWSVLVWKREHERYACVCKWTWTLIAPQPQPRPHMITGKCLCVQVNTWSLVSACVCKWTWTLLELHPAPTPTPTPHDHWSVPVCASEHMITGQCLCGKENMNVIGTHPTPTPTPHDHWSVLVWKREHERYWHPTQTQPQPRMITGQCLCVQVNMNVSGAPPHPQPQPHLITLNTDVNFGLLAAWVL